MKRLLLAAACAAMFAAAPALAQNSVPADAAAPVVKCSTLPDAQPGQPCPSNTASTSIEATGTIKTIDVAAGTVTLDDGKTYTMQTSVALNTFMPGQKVIFMFKEQDGKFLVDQAKPATDAAPAAAVPAAQPAPAGGY
jgi:Cu/Ag efflux protein CusF